MKCGSCISLNAYCVVVSNTPLHTQTKHTVFKKFSLTPSEKLTLTLHCNSDWLCKQLKCEISQRLSRKPFDTLKKIRRDYTSLGGLSKTVNFAFQATRVGGFFFIKQAWGKPLKREKFCIFTDSSKTLDIFRQTFPCSLFIQCRCLDCWLNRPFASVCFSTYPHCDHGRIPSQHSSIH